MIKLKFQTYLKLTLYIFFLFIGINRINATHIVGGELTYKCLGNNQFEITLLVYRDCINGDVYFDNPASIGIFNSNNQLVDSLSMPFRSVDDTLNIFNPCLVSQPNVCVHRTVYRDTIDLPFLTGGYTLAYQRCCRNETLNNIVLPLETGATYTTIITEDALLNCNSQATFLSWPPIYICANTPFTYNHSAIDSDGDSLSYKLCVPYSGATKAFPHPLIPSNPPYDTVIWNGIYSLNNLLGGVPLTIDEHTGIMTAIPNIIGQFVVGVCVDEYRDGVLIGQTRRDFQYNVRECIPTTALFDAPQAQCDNYTVTFDNQSLNSNNFLWNFNDPGNPDFTSTLENPSYTFSDTGRYQVMLIVQPGEICEDTITKSIYIQDNSIVGDFDYQINSCQTLISVQMTSTLSDTISGLNTWNWTVSNETGTLFTSNDPTPTFNFNQSDTLQITLHTYSANGCERTLTKTVPIYLINDTLLSDSIDICNGQSAALNPINNDQLIYSWSPASGLNNALNPNPIASPATSTLYTVTISDPSNRCSLTRSIYVAVHPFGIQIPDVIQNCQPSLQISSGPGDINNVYTWSTDPNFTNVIGNQNTVVVNPVGNLNYYYIRVVDNFGCSVIDSVRVEGNPINVELPNNFQAACSTDEIDLNIVNQIPSEQLTYAWTPTELFVAGTENTASPVLNSNIIGYHQVYVNVSNNSGCNIIDTSNVLILNNPVMDFEVGSIGCNGVTVNFNNLSVNAGLYQWTFFDTENNVLGTSNSINPSFTFPNLGEYHVMLTIGANVVCNDTIVKTITLSDPLNLASIGYEIVGCNNGVSIQFTNNSNTLTPIVYNVWSFGNGQLSFLANPLITFNQSGNFEVTLAIGTQAGCFDTTSVIIPINMINFNPEPVYYCDASPTVVLNSNGNGALNYNWSPSNAVDNPTSPNPTANSALSTIFTVTITDPATSCNIIDTVSLVSLNNIDLDFTPIQSCNSYVVSFLNQSNNALSYHWNFGDPSTTFDVSNSSNPIYIYPSTGVYNIELSLGFDTVCVQPVIKTVNITDPLIADFSYESTNCLAVATIDFHNESIGGSTDNNYLWYFNNGTTSTLENPTVNTTQTPFVATLLVTNPSNGCNDVITKEFHIQTISVNIPDSLTICDHTPVNLNQGGNLAYQYHWSPATGLNNPNIANPLANPLTTTTYFVTVTNASLFDTCVIVKQVKVIVPPVDLNLSVTNDTIICQGAITLSAQSSVNNVLYDWYNNEGTNIGGGSSITVTPTINSFYIVEATDQYGCTLSDTINAIKQNISLTDFDAVVCPHTNTTINVINNTPEINLVYSWTPASAIVQGATTANPTINVSANVELSYVATSALGCMQFGTIPVTINEIGGTIVANATPDTIQKGQSTQLSVNSNIDYTYNWAPISTLSNSQIANPVATPTETTTYNVFVTNSAGCIETSSVTVFVFNGLCEEPYIFVPNVFTPNDDSKNDILYVRGSAITSMTFMIYDRWGEKVFESKNISDGWDGKYKGKTLAPDVYGYYLKATCFEGNEFEKKGNITILK